MEPIFLIVDLFCGFGGTTTGFTVSNGDLHTSDLPHQRDIIQWAAKWVLVRLNTY